MATSLKLSLLPGDYAVCRLDRLAVIPNWALTDDLISITRTADELSIVCPQRSIPQGTQAEGDWRCLKVEGPLDFALSGILASLATPLADAGISIFALSTYDTDYLMVKQDRLDAALDVLRQAGHQVR